MMTKNLRKARNRLMKAELLLREAEADFERRIRDYMDVAKYCHGEAYLDDYIKKMTREIDAAFNRMTMAKIRVETAEEALKKAKK